MSAYSLLILPGDGIGPEVMAEVRKIIDWFQTNRGMTFEVSEDLVGGSAYDKQTDGEQKKAKPARPVQAVRRRNVGRPQRTENQWAEIGGHAKHVVQKTRSVRAE